MPSSTLYKQLFRGQPGEPGEAERMENTVTEYPYFSLAHLFLLKETVHRDPSYPSIAAMTALHVQNPFLLRYLLMKKDHTTVFQEKTRQETPAKEMTASISHGEMLISKMTEEIARKVDAADEGNGTATEPEPVSEPAATEPLLFEPLHTTDYFASQGIKLSEEAQTGDKLGKQLKSFTEWLKTMKKVHTQKATGEQSVPIDPAVEHMAEKSNKEEDVITETMAEVLIGQGKKKRAIEVYQKLLLHNPSKSAYFAAKIDSLKDS